MKDWILSATPDEIEKYMNIQDIDEATKRYLKYNDFLTDVNNGIYTENEYKNMYYVLTKKDKEFQKELYKHSEDYIKYLYTTDTPVTAHLSRLKSAFIDKYGKEKTYSREYRVAFAYELTHKQLFGLPNKKRNEIISRITGVTILQVKKIITNLSQEFNPAFDETSMQNIDQDLKELLS